MDRRRQLVFNLLVGNDDCHLKNLSFIVDAGSITLAPHYDMLATGVYSTRAMAGDEGRWPQVELAVRLADDVRHFGAVTHEAVMAAAAGLGVPRPVAQRVVREVVTRTLRQFDRVYAEYFPAEAGLLDDATLERTPVDDTAASANPRRGQGGDPTWAPAIEGHVLRVLRYVVLPEMRDRLSP